MALNSTSVIKLVDLLCEGPIEGLVANKAGIFVEETQIDNFSTDDISHDFKPGGKTQNQLEQGKNGTSTITAVNTEVGENYSETLNANNEVIARDYGPGQVTRQITDLDVDSIELLFSIPGLFSTAQEGLAKGQLFNGIVRIKVFIQAQGTAFNLVYNKDIQGISASNYQLKTPKLPLAGTGPWNVRVEKVDLGEFHFEVKYFNFQDVKTNIPLANGRRNQVLWNSIIEIQSLRTAYPFCAVAGLTLSTRQFSSVPTRAYKIRGRIIEIPSNAIVRSDGSLEFTGNFNGLLKSAWTTCPVCCWYDMVVNKRYGAGDFVEAANISWVDLYPLSQYANQLITTPDGKQEARFACNTVIGSQAQAFNVLQDLASVFRGMLYWQANTIQANADHGNLDGTDVSPVHLYNNSNVIGGAFGYSGTSLKTRSTSIRVRYNDPENFYKSNFVVVEDAALITKYGYQIKEILALGATSKWQAQRLGRWMLASEEIDGEVVTFSTGLAGAVVSPGQVFAVADQMRQGDRIAGRVSSATTSAVVTDQTLVLPSGANARLTCVMADGTVETSPIGSVSGATINVSTAFTSVPLAQSVWSIATDSVNLQKFRCLSVGDSGEGQYGITGVEHNDSIYGVADTNQALEFEDITTLDEAPAAPTGLSLSSKEIIVNNNTLNQVTAVWTRGTNAPTLGFDIRYKIAGGNYINAETQALIFNVDSLLPGAILTFQVRSKGFNQVQKSSAWTEQTFEVPYPSLDPDQPGQVIIPPDPVNVTIQKTNGGEVILRWLVASTGINLENLTAIIRHSDLTDGTGVWADSVKLTEVKAKTQYAVLPLIEGEYLIKFEHNTGKSKSVNAVSAVIDLPDPIPLLSIEVRREDLDNPPFQGQKEQVFYQDTNNGLVLDGASTIDQVPDFDLLSSIDFIGKRFSSGEYYFNNIVDLGAKFSILLKRKIKAVGIYPDDVIDARTELIDSWTDIDGLIADDTSAQLYFRASDQALVDVDVLLEDGDKLLLEDGDNIDLESDIDFGDWVPMESGAYSGRLFQFKAELTTAHLDQTPVIQQLGYTLSMESRIESSAVIASGAGAKAVTFVNPFYQTPSLGLTAFNLASGDYYVITLATKLGFTVTFYNSSNAAVDRNFEYAANGYGVQT